jgi:hypothetical protein
MNSYRPVERPILYDMAAQPTKVVRHVSYIILPGYRRIRGLSITWHKQFHEKTVRRSNEQSRFILIPMIRYIDDTMDVFLFT